MTLDAPETPPAPSGRRFLVGITGASGAVYSRRLIQLLVAGGHETHVLITTFGKRLLQDELGMEGVNLNALAGIPEGADAAAFRLFAHPSKDVGASPASGSFRHDGMVVVPCSSNTLGAVANGIGDQLVYRAAAVALKERMPLILCHRETPLSLIDIENMRRVTLAGAVVMPANPGFYLMPRGIEDLVDFVVGRVLDLLKVEHGLNVRWEERGAGLSGRHTSE